MTKPTAAASPSRWAYDFIYLPLGSAGFGGAERSLLDLAGRMAAQGKHVLVLAETALKITPFPDEAAHRGLELRWVDWAPEHGLMHNLRAALACFRGLSVRLIHFNISWRRGMWLIPLVARLTTHAILVGSMRAMPDPANLVPRKRYLFNLVQGPQLWRLPALAIGRVWARALHVTVSVNRDDYPKRLIAEYGFTREKMRVIYNGIEVPEHLPSFEEKRTVRTNYGFKDSDFVVCYFGRLSAEKGIYHLLDALAGLPPQVVALIIGEGPQEAELKAQVERLGVTSRVRFAGFLSRPESVVAACDLVAVPSIWYEAFGRTVVEALALGVPVVASRIGGMAELFEDSVHGLYVPAGDSTALRLSIDNFVEDPLTTQSMGLAGREWVKQHYAVERVVAEYSKLYRQLLKMEIAAWGK